MMKYEAGFIGAGNMGGALALAAMKKVGGDKVAVACSSEESTAAKAAKLKYKHRTKPFSTRQKAVAH